MSRGRIVFAGLGILALLAGMPTVLTITGPLLVTLPDLSWPELDTSPWAARPIRDQLILWAEDTWHTLRLDLGADGAFLLAVLTTGWVTWACLVWWTLCDLVFLLRYGARALRDRLHVTGPRGWITALLASAVISLNAPTTSAAPAADRVAVTAPQHPSSGVLPFPSSDTTTLGSGGYPDPPEPSTPAAIDDTVRPDCPRYRVARGDTLWELAQRHLADPQRWTEIRDLNADRIGNPRHLQPGWILLLPPDAAQVPTPPAIPEDAQWVTTAPGDTLTTIAERHLGNADRWDEIFRLNAHHPQPDGHVLRDPDLVFPGWHLALPIAENHRHTQPHISPEVDAAQTGPKTQPEPAPDRQKPSGRAVTTTFGTALSVGSSGLVATSLAAAVALGLLVRRRRRMRAYRPGSGDRPPLPTLAPAVHALRLAFDGAQLSTRHADHVETEPITPSPDSRPGISGAGPSARDLEVGVRDGQARALDLAAVRGLGLTGPGAQAAARALLVQLLATTNATIVIPDRDARSLISDGLPTSPRLRITEDLAEATTYLANHQETADDTRKRGKLDLVLVAGAERQCQRLQALLDNGTAHGIAGILLGSWEAAATVCVLADGLISATSPAVDELRGARLFHLNATDTRAIIDLLADTTTVHPDNDTKHIEQETTAKHTAEGGARAVDTHDDSSADGADDHAESPPNSREDHEQNTTEMATVAELTDPVNTNANQDDRPVMLGVFGPITLTWHTSDGENHDLTPALAPKHKALLVFLALHPNGTTRASVREALWPDSCGHRPYNAFYASLSQIRKALSEASEDHAADVIVQHEETVALNTDRVDVDYWQLRHAEHDRNIATTAEQRMEAWSRIAATYRGELADGMSALWLDGPREDAHRTVLDALAGMAAHYRGHDPHRRLQLLEHARLLNPENEAIYRDIMRVQAELGLTDAISRTVHLLATNLAEIGERPNPSTLTLARTLQTRHQQTVF
ncbi:LysM peptidoglycan-binding domain-containing protein [Saccharopolyspora shandongensis]|uniref:LysM peptidoglycan-binding domain-containing protein n=1 Tax=Saccharopolyspora shandongensis TaxID=418495 RepID=UPI00342398FA